MLDRRVASTQALQDIVTEHQAAKFTWQRSKPMVLVDAFTAQLLLRMRAGLNPANQLRFDIIVAKNYVSFQHLVNLALNKTLNPEG